MNIAVISKSFLQGFLAGFFGGLLSALGIIPKVTLTITDTSAEMSAVSNILNQNKDTLSPISSELKIGLACVLKLSIRTFRRARVEKIYPSKSEVDLFLVDSGRHLIKITVDRLLQPPIAALQLPAYGFLIDFNSSEQIDVDHDCFSEISTEIQITKVDQTDSGWPIYSVENLSKLENSVRIPIEKKAEPPAKKLKAEPPVSQGFQLASTIATDPNRSLAKPKRAVKTKAPKINKKILMFLGSSSDNAHHYCLVEHEIYKEEISIAFREKSADHKPFKTVKMVQSALLELIVYYDDVVKAVENFQADQLDAQVQKLSQVSQKSQRTQSLSQTNYNEILNFELIGKKKRCFVYQKFDKILVDFQNFYFNVADSEWKRSQPNQRITFSYEQYNFMMQHKNMLLFQVENPKYLNEDADIDPAFGGGEGQDNKKWPEISVSKSATYGNLDKTTGLPTL